MFRKLISLSLLLTTIPAVLGMEGQYKKEEVSEASLSTDAITLISSEGGEFEVVPQIVEFSDAIKMFLEETTMPHMQMQDKKIPLLATNKPVELLTKLINQVQKAMDHSEDLRKPIKLPSEHIIAKNLQIVESKLFENEIASDLKGLLSLTDFLCMPTFIINATASGYLSKLQKEQEIPTIFDLKKLIANWNFSRQTNELLIKHWCLQKEGIAEECTIKDLIAAGEELIINNGELDLSGKKLTSLEGLHDIPDIKKIQSLNLCSNFLVMLSDNTFNKLDFIKEIWLQDNRLITLSDFFELPNSLKWLALNGNLLTELPPSFFNSGCLDRLYLDKNGFTKQYKKEICEKIKNKAAKCAIIWNSK